MARTSATGSAWIRLRDQAIAEADGICQLNITGVCTIVATTGDHIIPASRWPAGRLIRSNVVAACQPCNRHKSNKLGGWRDSNRTETLDPYAL